MRIIIKIMKTLFFIALILVVGPTVAWADTVVTPPAHLSDGQSRILVEIQLPPNHHYPKNAVIEYQLTSVSGRVRVLPLKASFKNPSKQHPIFLRIQSHQETETFIEASLTVPYCSKKPPILCKMKVIRLKIPVRFTKTGKNQEKVIVRVVE